jgi:pimeloyl-ACP methyl ester carboxylesterase
LIRFDVERLTAVAALNGRGDTSRNDEPIMTFVTGPAYGWNTLQSMQPNAPADYRAALAAIRAPLLVIAGDRDEAFDGSQYAPVLARYSATGEVELIEGATHGGVLVPA